MKNKTWVLLILSLAALAAFAFVSCEDPVLIGGPTITPGNNPGKYVTFYYLTQNGDPANATTELYLYISQEIPGLSGNDITLSGVSGIQKGTLGSIGPGIYSLPISGLSDDETISVSVSKQGFIISGSPKTVYIYYNSGIFYPVSGVSLNKPATAIAVGGTETLYATIEPVNATNQNLTWSSSDNNVATVSQDGVVSAAGIGTATITVSTEDSGFEDTCLVTVSAGNVAVSGVSLNKSSTTIAVGGTETLYAAIEPVNATNQNLVWSSSDAGTATVSEGGVVSAIGAGTATIIVSTEDGGFEDTCLVTVSPDIVAVSGVSLNKSAVTIAVGGTETLHAAIEPVNATNQNLIWSSSDNNVASVSEGGVVSAAGIGTATITVSTEDGGYQDSCLVTVTGIPVSGVSLNKSAATIAVGGTETLHAAIEPVNATNQNLIWSSSDNNVASVSEGGVVSAVGIGTATITVSTEDGGFEDTCLVTVSADIVAVSGISLNKNSTTIIEGDTEKLIATISPSNATYQTLTWSSNAPSRATVSQDGVVSAVSVGTATITVTAVGGRSANCTVTVTGIPVSGVSLNKAAASIVEGGTETLTATITPSGAANKNLTWSSSDNNVATVSQDGVVSAVGIGTAIITVTTEDGGFEDSCTVTVLQMVSPGRIEYYWIDEHGSLVTTSGGTVTIDRGEILIIDLAASVEGSGYVVKLWLLNGVNTGQSGNTYSFSSAATGKHTVTLFVEKDGSLFNTNIIIQVQ